MTKAVDSILFSPVRRSDFPSVIPRVKVDFAYDYMSRRVGKDVYSCDTGTTNWTLAESRAFLYDGWNLISGTRHSTPDTTTTNHYVWCLDLSGSLQGAGVSRHSAPSATAGGIGGLLMATGGTKGTNSYFPTYDASGWVDQ